MAVTDTQAVRYEAWGGYRDPRLPTRVWNARLSSTGDATGGDQSLFLIFNPANAERLDEAFSLEELYLASTSGVADDVLVEVRNLGSFKGGVRPISFVQGMPLSEAPNVGLNPQSRITPMWLGEQVLTTTESSVVVIKNNIDTVILTIWAGGYVWGPRSKSAPDGGYQRPREGVFSK